MIPNSENKRYGLLPGSKQGGWLCFYMRRLESRG